MKLFKNNYLEPIKYHIFLTILIKFSFIINSISPYFFSILRYYAKRGYLPNLKNPKTFDEKLIWLMLYWLHPLKVICGDKYTMRLYVEEHGLKHILPELLGVYESVDEVDFNELPERFVLKCTHGSGFNIICRNKSTLNIREVKSKLDKWLGIDFSKVFGEKHYAKMKPRIICERFIDESKDNLPIDYKIYCFNGKAYCTLVCTERGSDSGTKYDFYDREWKHKSLYSYSSLNASREIPIPSAYNEMIYAAELLSKPFPFVRMDFYSINNKPLLGEMTFSPSGSIDTDHTEEAQYQLGNMIKLPEKYME